GKRIFFKPDFTVHVSAAPKVAPIIPRCLIQGFLHTAVCSGLALPAGIVCNGPVPDPAGTTKFDKGDLYLGVPSFGFLDHAQHGGLIENLPYSTRFNFVDDLDKPVVTLDHLGFCCPISFY